MTIEILGFIAGTLVAVSSLPQIVRSMKTKSTKDLAFAWLLINMAGQVLWIVYGIGISSISLIVMSSLTLTLVTILLILKSRFG